MKNGDAGIFPVYYSLNSEYGLPLVQAIFYFLFYVKRQTPAKAHFVER